MVNSASKIKYNTQFIYSFMLLFRAKFELTEASCNDVGEKNSDFLQKR